MYQNIFFYLSWFKICFKIQTTTKDQSMTVKQNMYSYSFSHPTSIKIPQSQFCTRTAYSECFTFVIQVDATTIYPAINRLEKEVAGILQEDPGFYENCNSSRVYGLMLSAA
jgi:hypothetical protein